MFQGFENWLQRGSIRQQMSRIFNLFAVLVLSLGLVATIGTLRIEQRSNALSDLTDVAFLTTQITRQVSLSKDYMGSYRARGFEQDAIDTSIDHAREAVAMNARLADYADAFDEDYSQKVAALNTELGKVEVLITEVRDAPRDVVVEESFLGPRYDAIDTTIRNVNALQTDAAQRVGAYSSEGLFEIQVLIGALIIGALIALGLVLFGKRLVANRVLTPISKVSDASNRIANGETELQIPGEDRDDEIGTLASSLNILRTVQREAAERVQKEHEREIQLQQEIEKERSEQQRKQSELLKTLADKFELKVSDMATEVAAASDQMSAAASELSDHVSASSSSVAQTNESLKEASNGITGAASACDEFALSINEVSRQAAFSSTRARKAADVTSEADETVMGLTNSAEKISQIIEVIAGIAQRTNLLALNASIEAARGGEAGRGFAVVASEVKELAVQTGHATEEVEKLIRDMQDATGKSAEALRMISKEVVELETTATAIASSVDQQSVAGQDLAKSIDLAATNTRTVSEVFDGVSRLSEASGATAAEVKHSAESLALLATRLRGQVSDFISEVRSA